MPTLIDPEIARRRARAAMEYRGLSWRELARRSGLSPDTVRRIVSPSSPRGFYSSDERDAIADACEVPRWFLERGFDGQTSNGDSDLAAQVTRLRGAVAGMSADILRHTQELQALRDRDRREGRLGEGE